MSDSRQNEKQAKAPAETARQEGAQGHAGEPASNTLGDGAVDVSDPRMEAEITDVAEQIHANA